MTTKLEQAARQAIHKINQVTALDEESDELLMEALAALREALAEQAEQEPVAQQDSDDKRLLREIFMLCEATEELEPTNDFMRGRIFEAKGIRRGIGNWYQDTFCGRSYMGEPVLNAAPVQQAEKWKVENKRDYENWKMAAEKAAAHEREACAKVCEERSHRNDDMGAICAAAIRARGETK